MTSETQYSDVVRFTSSKYGLAYIGDSGLTGSAITTWEHAGEVRHDRPALKSHGEAVPGRQTEEL